MDSLYLVLITSLLLSNITTIYNIGFIRETLRMIDEETVADRKSSLHVVAAKVALQDAFAFACSSSLPFLLYYNLKGLWVFLIFLILRPFFVIIYSIYRQYITKIMSSVMIVLVWIIFVKYF